MKFGKRIVDLVYPPACAVCQELLAPGETGCCTSCRKEIDYVKAPVCKKCGQEVSDGSIELCRDCEKHERSFVRGYPAMNYVSPVKEGVYAFKYQNRKDAAGFFAAEIIRVHGRELLSLQADALIPVPVHKRKLKRRGYNQAELLARELSNYLRVPVDTELLERSVNTPPQKTLDPALREKNMKSAFQMTKKSVNYKSVMLVDDIYTTGSTIEACTRLLKAHGIEDIYYTSICIGKGY